MAETVPLISCLPREEEEAWLAALREHLPGCRVAPFRALDEAERAGVRVAICADPDPADVAALPGLVWVQSLWAGVERLLDELPADGPAIVRMRDPEMAGSMAEAALAAAFYLHRQMPAYLAAQRRRQWCPLDQPRARQRRVGLLGLGEMGRAAARALAAAGFDAAGWSRSPKALEGVAALHGARGLEDILRRSDILILLLPLTRRSRGILDEAALARLPRGAAVVNFGRGALIDHAALIRKLDEGHISHALLDVFEQEPLPPESPLWAHPKVTIWPHVAAVTNVETASRIAATNIRAFLETGTIPASASRQRGY